MTAGTLLSLDVYAEQLILSVPFDQAPGRLIIVTELWIKAVKQVVHPQLVAIRSALSMIRRKPSAAPRNKTEKKRGKLQFVELVTDIRRLVFSLESHPLEAFMALHGPLLQAR